MRYPHPSSIINQSISHQWPEWNWCSEPGALCVRAATTRLMILSSASLRRSEMCASICRMAALELSTASASLAALGDWVLAVLSAAFAELGLSETLARRTRSRMVDSSFASMSSSPMADSVGRRVTRACGGNANSVSVGNGATALRGLGELAAASSYMSPGCPANLPTACESRFVRANAVLRISQSRLETARKWRRVTRT